MWNKKFVYILNYLKIFKAVPKNNQQTHSSPEKTSPTFHPTSRFCHVGWNIGMVCAITKFIKFRKRKKDHVGWCWMKFVPEQNFIQHVSTQKYEFSMLDWFGGVFHPTFINFCWFRTFVRSNCNSNFLMCFRILNLVSITNIYCGWGRHKTMYNSSVWQCITDTAKKRRKRRGTLQKRPNQKDGRIGRMRKYLCW